MLFAAIGIGGQPLIVVPGAELVFAHRANTDLDTPSPDREQADVDPALFESLTGEYDFGAFRVRVFVHERRLFGRLPDGSEHELLPLSPTRFYQVFPNTHEVEFLLDDAGRAHAARLVTPRGAIYGSRLAGPG